MVKPTKHFEKKREWKYNGGDELVQGTLFVHMFEITTVKFPHIFFTYAY
jgi:hypothetical protein